MRSERDAAVRALDKRGRRARRDNRARTIFVGALVVLFAILLPVTITATWAHRIVLNNDAYVSTIKPIAADPTVQAAVSREVTNEIYAELDPQQQIEKALPPRASFLAGPIANGVKGYLQNAVNRIVSSQQFQDLWVNGNQFAHQQLVSVLRGHSQTVTTTNGQVVLNLVPLINAALTDVQGFVSAVVGRKVSLPPISGNELPSAACARIGCALDRPVPSTCGQIALFPADKLSQAQRLVRVFDRAVLALLIITPLLFLISFWLSRRRRRTLLQLCMGGALGLVVFRRVLFWLQDQLINTGRPENKDARSVIMHQVLHGYFSVTKWFLVGAAVIVVLALVTGPYRWAVQGRLAVWHAGTATVAFLRTSVVDRGAYRCGSQPGRAHGGLGTRPLRPLAGRGRRGRRPVAAHPERGLLGLHRHRRTARPVRDMAASPAPTRRAVAAGSDSRRGGRGGPRHRPVRCLAK